MATNMYRADVTQTIDPASPNYGTLAKGDEARAAGARIESSTNTMLTKAAADVALGAYKAYDKQQQQGKVDALGVAITKEVTDLQSQYDQIVADDTSNKAKVEQDRAQVRTMADEIVPAAILMGEAPDEARAMSSIFSKENENKFISDFRSKQEQLMAARDAMPQRQHEMMLRSEALLRRAIAQTPEMANSFRQIAQQVTGKERVDLYSVNKLYENINFIEKQKEEAGKTIAKQDEILRLAFVADRIKGAGVGELQANLEYKQLTFTEKFALAQSSITYSQSIKDADAALKKGGDTLLSLATISKVTFENELLGANAHILSRLKLLGVSAQQIASGTVPPKVLESEQYKTLIEEGGTGILKLLDAQYKSTNEKLLARITTVPADASKARQAQEDLKKWYDETKAFYTQNKSSWLLATSMGTDGIVTLQKRLNVVNSLVQSLGLPPEVVASIGMVGDKTGYNDARARYPKSAKALDHFENLRNKAMQGVPDSEWMQLMKDVDSFNGSKQGSSPTTLTEAVASCVAYEQCNVNTTRAAADKTVVIEDPSAHVAKQLKLTFADPANSERLLKTGITALTAFMDTRIPKADKANVDNLINSNAEQSIYGWGSHGDKAKETYLSIEKALARYKDIGVSTGFVDATGASAVRVGIVSQPINVPQEKTFLLQDYVNQTQGAKTIFNTLNSNLSAVDDVLKIQATLTGVSIFDLRKKFMETFASEGTISEAYTAQTKALLTPAKYPKVGAAKARLGSQDATIVDGTSNAAGDTILKSLEGLE